MLSFTIFSTRLSIFASLVGFAVLGNVLTAKTAFMVTAYYNLLNTTMTTFFPRGKFVDRESIIFHIWIIPIIALTSTYRNYHIGRKPYIHKAYPDIYDVRWAIQ